MLPDGYFQVSLHDTFLLANERAKDIAKRFKCEVAIDRVSDTLVALGVPTEFTLRVLQAYAVQDAPEPEEELRQHPMDRVEAMYEAGEISAEEYEEYKAYWDEERSSPDPRWSETDNLRMEEDP